MDTTQGLAREASPGPETAWTNPGLATAFTSGPVPDDRLAIGLLRTMALIRVFEDRTHELFQAGEMPGFVHLCAGQEAPAAGVVAALSEGDYIFSTFRNHGHALAKGVDPKRLMAELYARSTGTNGGRGGSMHVADHSVGLLASGAIVGASPPLACGPALGSKLSGDGKVSVAFFGDGAMQQGTTYEAMNLAAVWKLSVLFVCENNGFGQATPISSVSPVEPYERARAHDIPGVKVDGQDAEEVYRVASWAVHRARGGEGPTVIEATTHSIHGGWEGETKKAHRAQRDRLFRHRDPLRVLRERLVQRGALSEDGWEDMLDEAHEVVDEAVEFARRSSPPDASDLEQIVYTS